MIEAYKKDVDRTLLREDLKRTVEERIHQLAMMTQFVEVAHRGLVQTKRAAGRPKDLEAIAELEPCSKRRASRDSSDG